VSAPDVSVIIPTYNRREWVAEAIASCRSTVLDVEIIVVDDGSADGTWEWLEKQPDVTALRQPNWGKCWAVNRGMEQARGEFVRFLDSDDWLLPGANERQVTLARSTQSDVVVAGYEIHEEKTGTVRLMPWVRCDDFVAQQVGECDSSHYSAYLFRRSFVSDIPHRPDYAWRDDRLFVIEMALKNPRLAVDDGAALAHRHHAADRLQFPSGMRAVATHLQHVTLYRKVLGRLEEAGQLTERRKRAATKVLWPLAHWIAYTHPHEGAEVARWVRDLDPNFEVPNAGLLGWMYRSLGFEQTERILKWRRLIKRAFAG